jgi:alginate O-acetyltransferase complex protein AlgJ
MPNLQQPLPAGGHEREELALIEIAHTTVSPNTVRLLLTFFLITIAVVPIAEVARLRLDASARQATGGAEGIAVAWSHLSMVPENIRSYLAEAGDASLWNRIVSGNRIVMAGLSGFERALENESLIGRSLRPPAQLVIAGWLGAGNERVYLGLEKWLFYSPDVDYVTGPGFLDHAQIRRRVRAAPEWTTPPQPDPRQAIARFKADLEERGITLIVMPTPLKPGVHPEMLTRRYADATGVLQNTSYQRLVDDLRREGVLVFDPSEVLVAARRTGPQYLAIDTHWRPEAMELVAERLGSFVASASLPALPDPGYRIERLEVHNTGDVARMLDLPADNPLFPPESVWLRRVLHSDGSPWRAVRDADVLLLGDSFSNIYSLESMGWGTSAGFAEQLSYALRRPVDRLVQNDEGSFATRAMLQQDPQRLHGKRVVVYQFAARELASGDWKTIALPAPSSR